MNKLFKTFSILGLALITGAVIALYMPNQSAVVAENKPVVEYGNALELQYARPWLEAQNKSAVEYGNALELQYAQPWLESQNKSAVEYGNALELQYARPWLEAPNKLAIEYGNALEMQYAQPWLDQAQRLVAVTGENPFDCGSSLEMSYACKYGYVRP